MKKGQRHSDASKEKMRAAKSDAHKAAIAASLRGRPRGTMSSETKERIAEGVARYWRLKNWRSTVVRGGRVIPVVELATSEQIKALDEYVMSLVFSKMAYWWATETVPEGVRLIRREDYYGLATKAEQLKLRNRYVGNVTVNFAEWVEKVDGVTIEFIDGSTYPPPYNPAVAYLDNN